jgi:hypothetical protein
MDYTMKAEHPGIEGAKLQNNIISELSAKVALMNAKIGHIDRYIKTVLAEAHSLSGSISFVLLHTSTYEVLVTAAPKEQQDLWNAGHALALTVNDIPVIYSDTGVSIDEIILLRKV